MKTSKIFFAPSLRSPKPLYRRYAPGRELAIDHDEEEEEEDGEHEAGGAAGSGQHGLVSSRRPQRKATEQTMRAMEESLWLERN